MKIITRKEAKALGLKRYFTSKACKHGHITERQTTNGSCAVCQYGAHVAARKRAPEKHRAAVRTYRAANREKTRACAAAWRKANPERYRGAVRRWKAANRAPLTAYENQRRARKLNATPPWAIKGAIEIMYALARGMKKHVDHIVPLKGRNVCGLHVHNNLQLLTQRENCSKGNKHG